MNVGDALHSLQAQGLERLDAQMLVLLALGRDPHARAWLLAHDDQPLTEEARRRLGALTTRRMAGEPMAYLRGEQAFFGLKLAVDARVLVPRPDTETLVNWALDLLPQLPAVPRIVDLGTGSGAIALALRHAVPAADITATDASTDALAVAQANAGRLGLPLRCLPGRWLQAVPGETFDLIVSNPPYIAEGDPHLPGLSHEPASALTAGADGLDDLRTIIGQAGAALRPGGWLLLEHGFDQAAAVCALLQGHGFEAVTSRRDLAGIDRCSGGKWPAAR
jgi:release factor glutamine methyltransferase